jgi:tetratricopeptide (TPR) repeat protein
MIFKNVMDPLALNVYHDIKNKLGSLKFTATLLKQDINPQERNKLIDNLLLSIDQMIAITTDFIHYYRFREKKYLPQESIDLKELVTQILAELKNDLQAKKITYSITSEKERPIIKSNYFWLKSALYNILHNAVKYNKLGGQVFVTIKSFPSGYMLTIQDTGKGMDKKEVETIFKKYFTKHSKELGTGLGVTFSKRIIESFGGQILLRSRPKEGTTFFIYLPKLSRQMKMRYFYASLASSFVIGFLALDYYYCLFPQSLQITKSKDKVIYRLENGAIARFDKEGRYKLEAYKNLFGTRTRTTIKLARANLYLSTASNPVKVYSATTQLQNHGTEFEVISQEKKSAVSVYEGEIQSPNALIKEEKGLIATQKGEEVKDLPPRVKDIHYSNTPQATVISWQSQESLFRLTFAKDRNMSIDVRTAQTNTTTYRIYDLPDGRWYTQIQAVRDDLLSTPATITIITLINYYRALAGYKSGDVELAKAFLKKSLQTIDKADYRPYFLYGKILLEQKRPKEAIGYLQQAYSIDPNPTNAKALIEALFKTKDYSSIPNIARSIPQREFDYQSYYYVGMSYYYLKKDDLAQEYLWKVLEADPKNIEVIETLLAITTDPVVKDSLEQMRKDAHAPQ